MSVPLLTPAPLTIRDAQPGDAEPLRALRNHYIASSRATFDEQALAVDAVESWMRGFADSGPHRLLVAERDGVVVGFASSQPYRAHPAFRLTIETSIYVGPNVVGAGIGSRLYDALFAALAGQELHRAVVGIALPNDASIRLHRRHGFTEVGVFDGYAIKNGVFVSSAWMQRPLGHPGALRGTATQASVPQAAGDEGVFERSASGARDVRA